MVVDSIYFLFLSHLCAVYMHDGRQTEVYQDKRSTGIAMIHPMEPDKHCLVQYPSLFGGN